MSHLIQPVVLTLGKGHLFDGEIAGFVNPLLDTLLLRAAEKGLGNGVVPAVSTVAHAGLELVGATEPSPIIAAGMGSRDLNE